MTVRKFEHHPFSMVECAHGEGDWVMLADYETLAARLAEAKRLLGLALIARDNVEVAAVEIRAFQNGTSDKSPGGDGT
jgi:hypothetical protein